MGESKRRRTADTRSTSDRTEQQQGHMGRPHHHGANWQPDDWNTTLYDFDAHVPHVSGELLLIPEGLANITRCLACGGRREERFDLCCVADRKIQGFIDTAVASSEDFEHVHRDCATKPIQYVIPESLAHVVESAVAQAERAIRKGTSLEAHLAICTTKGGLVIQGVSQLPPGSANGGKDRLRGIAELQRGVRARLEFAVPIGFILVGEVWLSESSAVAGRYVSPSIAQDRKEKLGVHIVTPTFTRVGLADITRGANPLNVRAGLLGPMMWTETIGPAALFDGMLACSNHDLRRIQEALETHTTSASLH